MNKSLQINRIIFVLGITALFFQGWPAFPASESLPQCVHWVTPFVFDEFADHATIQGTAGTKVGVTQANPDLCLDKSLGMDSECHSDLQLAVGDRVSIGNVCVAWTYIGHQTAVGGRAKWAKGWIKSDLLKIGPPSDFEISKREEWEKHRHQNNAALAQAVRTGSPESVSELLKDPKDSRQALGMAVIANRPDIVELAIKHGAQPDDDGFACMALLSPATNNIKILRQILNAGWNPNCRPNTKHSDRWTILLRVANKRRVGATPLTEPINAKPGSDPVEVAKALVEAGADLKLTDSWGGNALRHTLEANNVDVAAYLLDAGSDVNNVLGRDNSIGVQSGSTTLMEALDWYSLTYDPTMIKLLLQHHADIDYQNQLDYDRGCDKKTQGKCTFDGQTVLTRAAEDGYKTIVELLLQYGADPLKSRKDGNLAAEIAIENGHADIADIITKFAKKKSR